MSKYNDPSGKTMKAIFEDYAGELFLRKVRGTGTQAERTKHFPIWLLPWATPTESKVFD